jgi:hypothetical protein
MRRLFENKTFTWLLAALALLVLAACGQTPVTPETGTASLTVTVSGNGSVTGLDGDLTCTAAGEDTCSATVDEGTQVALTATAAAGSNFSGWTGGGCADAGNTCTFTVNGDTSVTANFIAAQEGDAQLTVSVTGDGSVTSQPAGIDCGQTCSATFGQGTEVTLTAAAGADAFQGWSGACAEATGDTCTFTITEDTAIAATFGAGPAPEGYVIASAADDAEELDNPSSDNPTNFPAGHTYTSSSDLDLAFDTSHGTTQYVGLRFSDVAIPAGATVESARIVFTAAGGSDGAVAVDIMGEANGTPAPFTQDSVGTGTNDISSRTMTSATTSWEITETWTAGTQYPSADLTAIVQEVVNLADWSSGNEMVIIIHGANQSEYRRAQSFGAGRTAPVLQVTLAPAQ